MTECYGSWLLSQALDEIDKEEREQEQIDPEEWDEFCEEVVIANAGGRPYEDQSWLYGRKDV